MRKSSHLLMIWNMKKVFYPLILITKKRYIGIKYEFDPEKGKKTSMGVVTKRRDNAPILKTYFYWCSRYINAGERYSKNY